MSNPSNTSARVSISRETRTQLSQAWACSISDPVTATLERACHLLVLQKRLAEPKSAEVSAASRRMKKIERSVGQLQKLIAADINDPLGLFAKIPFGDDKDDLRAMKYAWLESVLAEVVEDARRPWPTLRLQT